MMPVELSVFAAALFFALVALLQWMHRRAANRARVSRGLREYVACEVPGLQVKIAAVPAAKSVK